MSTKRQPGCQPSVNQRQPMYCQLSTNRTPPPYGGGFWLTLAHVNWRLVDNCGGKHEHMENGGKKNCRVAWW